MIIVDAILCDSATVREGLLHILGGGITVIARPAYPSPLNLTLALLVEDESDELSGETKLTIDVFDDNTSERIGGAEVGWEINGSPKKRHSGVPFTIPLTLPLPIALPRPSLYVIKIALNGEVGRTLRIGAMQAKSMPNVTSRSMII